MREHEHEQRHIAGLRVVIDRERCIGTGSCVHTAPESFVLDATHIVTFVPDGAALERERLIDACASCPVSALSVYDEEERQLVP